MQMHDNYLYSRIPAMLYSQHTSDNMRKLLQLLFTNTIYCWNGQYYFWSCNKALWETVSYRDLWNKVKDLSQSYAEQYLQYDIPDTAITDAIQTSIIRNVIIELNRKRYLLPIAGGYVINLQKGEVRQRNRLDYFSYELPVFPQLPPETSSLFSFPLQFQDTCAYLISSGINNKIYDVEGSPKDKEIFFSHLHTILGDHCLRIRENYNVRQLNGLKLIIVQLSQYQPGDMRTIINNSKCKILIDNNNINSWNTSIQVPNMEGIDINHFFWWCLEGLKRNSKF